MLVILNFTSVTFLVFLAASCLSCYLFPRKLRYIWLLGCSYFFYVYPFDNIRKTLPALALLLAATIISYLCALGIAKATQKLWRIVFLCVSLASCLGMLLVCKYSLFVFELFNLSTASLKNLILPLGISYYTLQTVSYSMDIYRKKYLPEKNVLRYALYVSFFPGIVTGPINRANQMLPQYKIPAAFNYELVAGGLFRILWGICKKMILADNIGSFTATVFGNPQKHSGPVLVVAALLFAYQLYADFSGSCDIAIGAARMLGFTFKENFNRPFAAKTFGDLWKRWHISLTSFFREYLYFPLGGSRCSPLRTTINTMAIFVVSGLWHGANMGYLLWGLANGAVMILAKNICAVKEKTVAAIPVYRNQHVRGFFQRIFVYLLFAGCMLFFATALFGGTVSGWFAAVQAGWGSFSFTALFASITSLGLNQVLLIVLAGGIVLIESIEKFAVSATSTIADWIRRRYFFVRWPLYLILLVCLLLFGVFGKSSFIYQQY